MKTKQFFILITLLFGLSLMCEAQNGNNKKETSKERMERVKREKATKDSLSISLKNNEKQVIKETPKQKAERIKKEKATKDSISTASYQQEIERLKKENAEKEKLVADLQIQADAKADVENKLANAEKTNFDLKTQINAKNSYADSLSNQLLAFEAKAIENKTYEKAKVDTSVKNPPVIVNVPAKSDTVKKSVPIKKKTYIQKKGTLVIDNNTKTVFVRKSDMETFKDQIASLKSKGFKEKDVNK